MILRPRSCRKASTASDSSCKAIVWVDSSQQKQRLAEEIRLMQSKIREAEDRVEHFHRVAVPAFSKWLNEEFGEHQKKIQELEEQRRTLHQRIAIAQQVLAFAPDLKRDQLEEIINISVQEFVDPLLALHQWTKKKILEKRLMHGGETPHEREKRQMRALAQVAEEISDVLLARFQQEFEAQATLEVSGVPHEWIQQMMMDFLEHYRQDDGNPILSLIFFLRERKQEERIGELVREFIDRHFPKRHEQGRTETDRMESFFEGFEEMLYKMGGSFFGGKRGQDRSSQAHPEQHSGSISHSDEIKTVFRRLARELHPDTAGHHEIDTLLWMEVQRLYREGNLKALLQLEMDFALKKEDLPLQQLGLANLMEAKQSLERQLKTKKSEWIRLSKRPEAKFDRSLKKPDKLQVLLKKFQAEFKNEAQSLEQDLMQLYAAWTEVGLRRRRR